MYTHNFYINCRRLDFKWFQCIPKCWRKWCFLGSNRSLRRRILLQFQSCWGGWWCWTDGAVLRVRRWCCKATFPKTDSLHMLTKKMVDQVAWWCLSWFETTNSLKFPLSHPITCRLNYHLMGLFEDDTVDIQMISSGFSSEPPSHQAWERKFGASFEQRNSLPKTGFFILLYL